MPGKPHPAHKVYPYLLRGLVSERPNHVWATDITYPDTDSNFMRFLRQTAGNHFPQLAVKQHGTVGLNTQ